MSRDLSIPDPRRCGLDHQHRHGETTDCYNRGRCRCQPCRLNRSRARQGEQHHINRLAGRNVWTGSAPSARRLQALAAVGYSTVEISRLTGLACRNLNDIRLGAKPYVTASTEQAIKTAYSKYATTPSADPRAGFTRAIARRNGYLSAMAWASIDGGITG